MTFNKMSKQEKDTSGVRERYLGGHIHSIMKRKRVMKR